MKLKTMAMNAAKLGLVVALIWWLSDSGKLDFRQLEVLYHQPRILAGSVLVWGGCYLLAGAFRWYLLLRGLRLEVSYGRVLNLQLIGFFFNTAIPGAVGGDIIKALYVIRDQKSDRKSPAMLSILLDRVIGLASLFVLASGAVLLNSGFFLKQQTMMPLALFALTGLVGLVAGLSWVLFFKDHNDPLARLLGKIRLPGAAALNGIYLALRSYRDRPLVIVAALSLSILIQLFAMLFAQEITTVLTGSRPDLGSFTAIYAVGVMATALPLAPGGLGVGHVAFDRLFALGGLAGGANVFNIMVLTQLTLNLSGFLPYLFYRRRLPQQPEELGQELRALSPASRS